MSAIDSSLLQFGVATLRKEADALASAAAGLGDEFLAALDMILNHARRVAVSGMGKSGHIARKIAATFSSTGTPAYFIHPAEACHGDLGMIGMKDVVLCISNSGATKELAGLVKFAQRHGLGLIAMTHEPASPLAKAADVCLSMKYAEEACPIGCAPTVSTTVALGLGDALAMALLHARGFTVEDFNELHPGGALGLRLLPVDSIMHVGDRMPLVNLATSLPDILLEMTVKGFGCAGVVNQAGELVGIITDGDLRRRLKSGLDMNRKASDIMTENPLTIPPSCSVSRALRLMNDRAITSLFVMDGKFPLGIIHMHDCLKAGD